MAQGAAHHLHGGAHELVQLHRLLPVLATTGEGEELAGELGGAHSGALDLAEGLLHVGGQLVEGAQEGDVAEDGGEQVVEVVGDTAGEGPDRLHLLRLEELPLQAGALAAVHQQQQAAANPPLAADPHRVEIEDAGRVALPSLQRVAHRLARARTAEEGGEGFGQHPHRPAEDLPLGQAGEDLGGGGEGGHVALRVASGDAGGRAVQHALQEVVGPADLGGPPLALRQVALNLPRHPVHRPR